jgi:hypothetical protein
MARRRLRSYNPEVFACETSKGQWDRSYTPKDVPRDVVSMGTGEAPQCVSRSERRGHRRNGRGLTV